MYHMIQREPAKAYNKYAPKTVRPVLITAVEGMVQHHHGMATRKGLARAFGTRQRSIRHLLKDDLVWNF